MGSISTVLFSSACIHCIPAQSSTVHSKVKVKLSPYMCVDSRVFRGTESCLIISISLLLMEFLQPHEPHSSGFQNTDTLGLNSEDQTPRIVLNAKEQERVTSVSAVWILQALKGKT